MNKCEFVPGDWVVCCSYDEWLEIVKKDKDYDASTAADFFDREFPKYPVRVVQIRYSMNVSDEPPFLYFSQGAETGYSSLCFRLLTYDELFLMGILE